MGRIKFKVKEIKRGKELNVETSPTKFNALDNDLDEMDYIKDGDISDEFIEINCAMIESPKNDIVCKVCWSSEQT